MSHKSTVVFMATAVLGLAAIAPTAASARGLGGSGAFSLGRSATPQGTRFGAATIAPTAGSARGLGGHSIGNLSHSVPQANPSIAVIWLGIGQLLPATQKVRGQGGGGGSGSSFHGAIRRCTACR